MNSDWISQIKDKIEAFFKELEGVCKDSGRNGKDVQVLFATKYLDPQQFASFVEFGKEYTHGKLLIGENRVQDAGDKFEFLKQNNSDLQNSFTPILIGPLQSNKINKAISYFTQIHAIDSKSLIEQLNIRLQREHIVMPIFFELNISGEMTKHGLTISDFEKIMKDIKYLKQIQVRGVMTMAPFTGNHGEIHQVFRTLKTIANKYNLKTSMGMSNDWKIAVEEGTDIIRIGSKIFSV
jgi:pyridoxal phosphate enzyme (YggS family)